MTILPAPPNDLLEAENLIHDYTHIMRLKVNEMLNDEGNIFNPEQKKALYDLSLLFLEMDSFKSRLEHAKRVLIGVMSS